MPIFCNSCGGENRDTSKFCSACGAGLQQSSPTSGPLTPGVLLENRYKIVNLIKAGGMGAVYKAVDDKLDSICTIKELLPPYSSSPQELAQATQWFKREAKLLARLDHSNLPKVSDYFINNGRYYLAMTFIEGEDLETMLSKEGKPGLPVDKVIKWAKQILQVLDYLHKQNPPVVYRDIKPGNIMIHKDGRAMLIDFGIARLVQEKSNTKKTAIGTPGYSPVEQCKGQVEPRSDLYALGATMHHLITGIEPLPFKFEPLSKIIPNISPELENILAKSLKDNLTERFNNAEEMKIALEGIGKTPQSTPAGGNTKKTVKITASSIKNEMLLISGSSFQMGSDFEKNNEKPIHKVTVDSFYMSKYPVTNKEYKEYKPAHKSHWYGADYPVDTVNWYDAINYCNWLSDKEGYPRCYIINGNNTTLYSKRSGYRIPTEAEWEYACRAGTITEYYWGDDMDEDYCWYKENSAGHTHQAGQKKPNNWGLYDMSGNVWEWCWDWYDENYYSKSPDYNPMGADKGSKHILRGGSWNNIAKICRSAERGAWPTHSGNNHISFRLVRTS